MFFSGVVQLVHLQERQLSCVSKAWAVQKGSEFFRVGFNAMNVGMFDEEMLIERLGKDCVEHPVDQTQRVKMVPVVDLE